MAVCDNSSKSSFETWIFSGAFLALLEGKIGAPLLEISPLYKLSKSSPISSSSSTLSSTCSTCFLSLYKGEISKSGTPILPSKRARKTPEKFQVSKEDLEELSETAKPEVPEVAASENVNEEQGDVSLDQVIESEDQAADDTENSNS